MIQHNRKYLHYIDAKPLINNADILLYTGNSIDGGIIRLFEDGLYAHVGMAAWIGDKTDKNSILEIIQFIGSVGGYATSFDSEVLKNNECIDIYRASPANSLLYFNENSRKIEQTTIYLDAKSIVSEMRKMEGLPYGYNRVWWLIKHKLFWMFMKPDSVSDDNDMSNVYPICSTAIAHCYSKNGYDLVKNKADEWTEPVDIARSPLLNYLFTITG
jgi:hypothetical protein